MTERKALLDAILVCGVDGSTATQTAPALGALGLHQVTPPCAEPEDLSARSDFKALGGGLFRFNAFRTSHRASTFFQKERAI